MVSPGEDLRLVSVPPNAPGKGLLHTDIQGKQLRGDLPEELSFSLNRGQRMDQMPLLAFVGETSSPSDETSAPTLLTTLSRNRATHEPPAKPGGEDWLLSLHP